jgi:signal transduction histidine kinase
MSDSSPRPVITRLSHELRTPLNAIISFAELLRTGMVVYDSADYHKFLRHISTSGKHLLNVVNDLLDHAALECGEIVFSDEAANLNRLVREMAAIADALQPQKRVRFELEENPALDAVMLDAVRFKQILYNFLQNAVKHTPPHGSVRVRLLEEGASHFKLVVEDDGVGIAPEVLPGLFEQGSSLSLVRRLVEIQGGHVGVRSVQGCGSTFHAVLPRRPLHPAKPAQATKPSQSA